ncbi:hypothetical protein C499_03318 [Halogeometricum borinquense DSM 11551]|uniref:N-acetyltransferase domain-containing protein n=1 Tax=Halogeometricum borinquense (strain ATCC 700274 / DSM 11551 / JCM 10706 / KCTC 4070 / PR3) TaxID=469382 RepID=E4NR18_HALBP|nr:GNAT family N-acetyltransferase [Halogeometricum borinquense]ADQ66754.1 hypothetical protein Hbor_11640 [Halogeometricum borinquense DSM 11551]ELY30263.1 hypothetical protein C499_03318 [Halogeometricum borinquense DSM 11551]
MSLARHSETVELDDQTYLVRPFQSDDESGLRGVYESVSGRDPGHEWFETMYGSESLFEDAPIVVIEFEGDIVGMLPSVAYRVRVGEKSAIGLLGRDVMVHPEHRRRGVFTAATNVALGGYLDYGEATFIFGHMNEQSRQACEEMGWNIPSMQPQFIRPRNVRDFVRTRTGQNRSLRGALTATTLAGNTLVHDAVRRERGLCRPTDTLDVQRVDGVPADRLTRLHETATPETIHPIFDVQTIRAHFSDPDFTGLRTYVAARGGSDVAALVVSERRWHRTRWHSIVHVAPLSGGKTRKRALAALLERALTDKKGSDSATSADAYRVAVPFPSDLLRSFGFLSDRTFPMSRLEPPRLSLGYRVINDGHGIRAALADDSHHLWHVAM